MSGILRLVVIGLVIWFIYRFIQKLLVSKAGNNVPPSAAPATPPEQAMRRCAHCQVHVPEGESTQSKGEYFCCEAHRDAYFREHR